MPGCFYDPFFELLTWKKTKNIFSVRFFSLTWKKDFGDFKWNKKSFFHVISSLLNPSPVQSDDLSGKIIFFIAQMVSQISYLFRTAQTSGRNFFN